MSVSPIRLQQWQESERQRLARLPLHSSPSESPPNSLIEYLRFRPSSECLTSNSSRVDWALLTRRNFTGVDINLKALLNSDVEGWNQWRLEHFAINPAINLDSWRHVGNSIEYIRRRGFSLRNKNLRGADLSNVNFRDDTDLSGTDLQGANLSHSIIQGVDFRRANLYGANFSAAIIDTSLFAEANLSSADFSGAIFRKSHFDSANLNEAILAQTTHDCTDFRNANLSSADLSAAILQGVDFSHGNLSRANFTQTTHEGTNYSDADLSFADLRGMKEPDFSCLYYSNSTMPVDLHYTNDFDSSYDIPITYCEMLRLSGFSNHDIGEFLANSIKDVHGNITHRGRFGHARLDGTRFDPKFVY